MKHCPITNYQLPKSLDSCSKTVSNHFLKNSNNKNLDNRGITLLELLMVVVFSGGGSYWSMVFNDWCFNEPGSHVF